ncbi:hypothetical protein HK44_023615 [Pseudomonas fluorescens HK44]|uniref:Uncharacterized protein n=1 Tax=Pseudomonas fluorescens HK44 TaxID=1042209 RepID=A0A010SYC1_PSEFL|nr:hypothetical protein [Pseudomonas fluorescens]EXF95728.1 hypothetical protein HK44_023615 [Pseudomonas fluorescens HK44]
MSNVILFDPPSSIVRDDEPPHIDPYSFALLVGVFNDLTAFRDSEPDREPAALMRKTTTKLNAVLARFEPPKGAA